MSAETEPKPARSGARSAPNGAGNEAVTAAARLAEVMDSLVIWRGECEARLGVVEALTEGQAEEIAQLRQEQEGLGRALAALEKRMASMASWAERKNQQVERLNLRLDAIGDAGQE